MTQWYYADAQRQRQGPVDTDTLRTRLSQGIVDHSSLVWREGLPKWVSLGEIVAELHLDAPGAATPPPPADASMPNHPVHEHAMHETAAAADPARPAVASLESAPAGEARLQTWTGSAELAGAGPHGPSAPEADAPATAADTSPAAPLDAADERLRTAPHTPGGQPWSSSAAPEADAPAWPTASVGAADAVLPTTATATGAAVSQAAPAPAGRPLPSAWDSPTVASPVSAAVHDAPVVYAGLWRRVAASILDSLVTTFAVYLIVIPLVFVIAIGAGMSDASSALEDGNALGIALLVLSYGIGLAIPTVYFAWMQSSRLQASLGKLACGIKVVRADSGGARAGFWRNLLRYVAYMLISVLTLGIGLIVTAFMAGMSQRKQAPHDKVCDTLVVDRWAFTDHPERQSKGLDTVSIVVLVIYGLLLLFSLVVLSFMLAAIGMGNS